MNSEDRKMYQKLMFFQLAYLIMKNYLVETVLKLILLSFR